MGSGHKTLLYGNAILLRHANSNMVRNLNFIITIFISNCETLVTLHRGAFCQFPFRWIYYYGSNKTTGKETGKTHLCALVSMKFHSKKSPSPIQSISRLDNHNFKHFLGQKYYCLAKFVQSEL